MLRLPAGVEQLPAFVHLGQDGTVLGGHEFDEGDKNMVSMPLFHVGGSSYVQFGIHDGFPSVMTREVDGMSLAGAILKGANRTFLVPAVLAKVLAADSPVYGITHGFGPLVAFNAADSAVEQGSGLIAHLASAQGRPLDPEVCRLVVWLRLSSMRRGYSAVSPEFWQVLAEDFDGDRVRIQPKVVELGHHRVLEDFVRKEGLSANSSDVPFDTCDCVEHVTDEDGLIRLAHRSPTSRRECGRGGTG